MLTVISGLVCVLIAASPSTATSAPSGFRPSPWFDELVREEWLLDDVRVLAIVARSFDPTKRTRLIFFATPNGNTIEQSLGCQMVPGLDWHYDIQHVAAQVRYCRSESLEENIVLVCLEAEGLSWPAWKRRHPDAPERTLRVVEIIRKWIPGDRQSLVVAAHSGGGSLLFSLIDAADEIPGWVERLVFLDANYSYDDSRQHGDKLLKWLEGDDLRQLVVVAYDDRSVTLNGVRVVGPDGGTYRATERMRERFAQDLNFEETESGEITFRSALGGRLRLATHANPAQRILHTALVGEMNGLLFGLANPGNASWARLGGPRAYGDWIQPAPAIPPRPASASGGSQVFEELTNLTPPAREDRIVREILSGNLPEFQRSFRRVTVTGKDAAGKEHAVILEVMPDYLAIGSDADFVRVPLSPFTAARIADAFGCSLPTRKLVDEIYRAATVKLEPLPMTEARESPVTFLAHHRLIEQQRTGRMRDELLAGIKKDLVITNRLSEKPNRVAIYGWHRLDGNPIQPLSTVHRDSYVDYSHGVRLIRRAVLVDGKARDLRHVLHETNLAPLVSDEGPVARPTY